MTSVREWYYMNKLMALLIVMVIALITHIQLYEFNLALLVETILFALVAFIFFDWVTEATTKKELFHNVLRMLKNHTDNTGSGFERVILNAETIPYTQLIQESSEIYICHVYGRTWLSTHQRVIMESLKNNPKMKLNFIIYSSKNPSIKSLANIFTSGDKDMLIKKIEDSIQICKEIQKEYPNNVVIKQIKNSPFFGGLYIFDNKALQIPLSTSTKNYSNFIAYEFEDVSNEICGYKIIKNQIDELLS